jgi:hypothetical protein
MSIWVSLSSLVLLDAAANVVKTNSYARDVSANNCVLSTVTTTQAPVPTPTATPSCANGCVYRSSSRPNLILTYLPILELLQMLNISAPVCHHDLTMLPELVDPPVSPPCRTTQLKRLAFVLLLDTSMFQERVLLLA